MSSARTASGGFCDQSELLTKVIQKPVCSRAHLMGAKNPSRPRGKTTGTTQVIPAPTTAALTIDGLLKQSIRDLGSHISIKSKVVASHCSLMVEGLEQPAAIEAFATYALIAGIGQGIRINLAIATELLGGGPPFDAELQRDVERLIGSSNSILDDFREDQRDPWFTECLGHALLCLSRVIPALGPQSGRVEAITPVHLDVRDHGLDLVGLHIEQALLGLSIAEAKASENRATQHGGATATLFSEVDSGRRDAEIRGKVQILREGLSTKQRRLITPSFWHEKRVYFAVISYGAASTFTPNRARPAYNSLAVDASRVRLLAIALENYRQFFDTVADRVRALVPIVVGLGGTP